MKSEENGHESELPLMEQLFPKEYLPVAGWVILVVSVLFIVMGVIPQMMYGYPKSPNELGDTFGVVNALFSGLGFAGLIITILIQIREFGMAQQDRKEATKQHTENVLIQKRISQQQEGSSVVQAIATWSDLNPHRKIDRSKWTYTDLEYLHARFVNLRILQTTRNRLLGLSEAITERDLTPAQCVELGQFFFDCSDAIFGAVDLFRSRSTNSNAEITWDAAIELIDELRKKVDELYKRRLSMALTGAKHAYLIGYSKEFDRLKKELKQVQPPSNSGVQSVEPIHRVIAAFRERHSFLMGNSFDFDSWGRVDFP